MHVHVLFIEYKQLLDRTHVAGRVDTGVSTTTFSAHAVHLYTVNL